MVAVEGNLMNFRGESVGVVAECVFDPAEELFGRRVGECLGHRACALFEERLKAFQELADACLTVCTRCGHKAIGVSHGLLTEGDLLHQQ